MYLNRKIDSILTEWKKNINKKPLIIKRARQIGKTKSIKILLQKIIKMSWK